MINFFLYLVYLALTGYVIMLVSVLNFYQYFAICTVNVYYAAASVVNIMPRLRTLN
jgi:hypothetical protein